MSANKENTPRPKPKACRRLFTPEEPVERPPVARVLFSDSEDMEGTEDNASGQGDNPTNSLEQSREEYIRNEQQRARERWNFDFVTETPLEGNWEWEKVESEPPRNCISRYGAEIEKVQSDEENHSL